MIDDLILRVPNVERRCAITCLVTDAQDCLPVRTRLGRSECLRGTCEPAKWKATLRNDHIAWQGYEPHNRLGEMEMDGNNRRRMYATARRSVPWAAVLCMWGLPGQVVPCGIVVPIFRIAFIDSSLMGYLALPAF